MSKKWSKLLVMLVIVLTMVIGLTVVANAQEYGGTAKGVVWSVNTDTGVLNISVEGPMGTWTQGSQPWYKHRASITSIEFSQATSHITSYAFSDLYNVKEIVIPNSVEAIDDYAFIGCSSAELIDIPISVATWGTKVFNGCVNVSTIITQNQTDINKDASLWDATVGSSAQASGKEVKLIVNSKSIGQYAFYGLSTVTDVTIPDSLSSINDYAFYGFVSPFSLNLTAASKIGEKAFYGCTGVTKINLPVAKEIGAEAFYGCTAAKEINAPAATSIGNSAFENCSAAEKIYIGASNITWGSEGRYFAGCTSCTELFLGNINFPNNKSVMQNLGRGKEVHMTLGKNISTISTLHETYVGSGMGKVTLDLEENSQLSNVAANAFKDTSYLKEVDFSNSARNMTFGANAFNNCANIEVFSTNTGTLSLTTLAMGNLKKLKTLNWNASSTNLGWTPPTITCTRTLSATSVNASNQHTIKATYADLGNSAYIGNGITSDQTSDTHNPTATLSYSFDGQTALLNHPMYSLGASTASGTVVNLGKTCISVPAYMFTSGIQMVETSSGTQSIPYTSSKTLSKTVTMSDGSSIGHIQWLSYTTSGNRAEYNLSAISTTEKISGNLQYALIRGTKSSGEAFKTKIKIAAMNSLSNALNYIGQNYMGSINYDLATSTSNVALGAITNNSNIGNTNKEWGTGSTNSVPLTKTNPYAQIFEYDGDSVRLNGSYWSYNTIVTNRSSNNGTMFYTTKKTLGATPSDKRTYSNYWGYSNTSDVDKLLQGIIGDKVYINHNIAIASTQKQTSYTATSVTSNSNNYSSQVLNDGATTINLARLGKNASISKNAFARDSSVTKVYLGSNLSAVAADAFFTKVGSGTMYIYGSTADTIANLTGIKTNNSYTISKQPTWKDYGMHVAQYQVGSSAYAHVYQTSTNEYLINITGTGTTYDSYTASSRPSWYSTYGKYTTELIVDSGITSIGSYLFYQHPKLETVTLPTTITKIGDYAFADCDLLKNTDFLTNTAAIGSGAFANCDLLKSAFIPSMVKTLGSGIYSGSPVETITYTAVSANNLTNSVKPFAGVGGEEVETELNIEDNVTYIPAYMLLEATVDTVNVGAGVENIGEAGFSGSATATVTIDSSNTKFKNAENGDIYSADGLTFVTYLGNHEDEFFTVPDVTGTTIAAGAFYGQPYVTQVSFNSAVIAIGDNAFAGCKKLSAISVTDYADQGTFEKEVQRGKNWNGGVDVLFSGLSWDIGITKGAMKATLWSDGTLFIEGSGQMKSWASASAVEWSSKVSSIKKVTFNGNITSIGAYAFAGCSNLTVCDLPETVDKIGQYAYYNCTSLEKMRIPDAVTSIQTYTFAGCSALSWVDCGLGIQVIEPFAFTNCTNVRYIVVNGTCTKIKANAFTGDTKAILLLIGKQSKTGFEDYTGIDDAQSNPGQNVARICYLNDIDSGRILKRYPANNTTASNMDSETVRDTDLYAYAFDTDNDGKSDYLHIAGSASMETNWSGKTSVPWDELRGTLTKVRLEDDVQSVGPYAFTDCTALKYIRIGTNASVIKQSAFAGCSALENMSISVKSLRNDLTSTSNLFVGTGSKENGFAVVFEDTAEVVPNYMFQNCENLTNLTFGKNVQAINQYAFAGCVGLKSVYIKSDAITTSDPKVFTNAGTASGGFTVEIAANVTKIPAYLFNSTDGNPFVTRVFADTGSYLDTIGASAFSGCNMLASAEFANCGKLQYINAAAFQDCTRLVTADFSNCPELLNIENDTFNGCLNLADFSISNDEKIDKIGDRAFQDCLALDTFVLPESVTKMGVDAYKNWVPAQVIYVLGKTHGNAGQGGFQSVTSGWYDRATVVYTQYSWDVSAAQDKSVMAYYTLAKDENAPEFMLFVVGQGDMKDYEETVQHWKGGASDIGATVNAVVISDGVTHIGNFAFNDFTNCKKVTFGKDIITIGKGAFKNDAKIPEVDLSVASASLDFIDESAFRNCSGISTVNLSGCDALKDFGTGVFAELADASIIYVSNDYLYDKLANVNGNIKSDYGTTSKTKIVTVKVFFEKDLVSQGVMSGTEVTWTVEATCNDNLAFKWFFATSNTGDWTEITSAIPGYTIVSTPKASKLVMDSSIVTLDKNGYYYYCQAVSPYYTASSKQAALAVYSAAITPKITVIDKNGDAIESNTWIQGPVTINITEGQTDFGSAPTYQYKLKANGTWRNTESKMTYNTPGIVTFYCRAIINGDANTASPSTKYILKIDNEGPDVSITADPEFESAEQVELTATGTDNVSGVQSISWYKTASDGFTGSGALQPSGVIGYVPLTDGVDMYQMTLAVKHYHPTDNTVDEFSTTWAGAEIMKTKVGETETPMATGSTRAFDSATETDAAANITAANKAVTDGTITEYNLYQVHVMDKDNDDFAIDTTNKGVISIPVPAGYDTNKLAVYTFARTGTMAPISTFSISGTGDNKLVTFSVNSFGYFMLAQKASS